MSQDPSSEALPPQSVQKSSTGLATVLRPRPSTGLAATFRSLRHRNYRLYFFGQLVSLIGTWMQTTAMTWLAYDLTHQSKWPALVSAAQILPTFLLGAWGGALADRWPKRKLIFVTQSAYLLLALVLTGLAFGNVITPMQLLVVTAASGVVQAVDLPARLAFVMDMTGREDLINAVGLNSLMFNVARAVGPAAAGLLLNWLQPWACFLANALSYAAVLWALACMDIAGSVRVTDPTGGIRLMLEGFAYLVRRRELAFLVMLAGTTAFFGWPFVSLLPALARDELASSQSGYSWMVSGTGIGALIAAWVVATFGSVGHARILIRLGVAMVSLALVGLGVVENLIGAIVCCGLLGCGLILFLATSQSVVQLSTGDHNRGRVMGIWAMMLSGAVPLGNLIAGPAADQWGVPLILCLLGVACGASALGLLILFRRAGGRA
jgi:MFS family permease